MKLRGVWSKLLLEHGKLGPWVRVFELWLDLARGNELHELGSAGTQFRVFAQQESDHLLGWCWVAIRNLRYVSLEHQLGQGLHVLRLERKLQSNEMIQDDPKRPDVRLRIIRLVSPYFGRCEVWSSCLGIEQPIDAFLRYIEVANLHSTFSGQENVSWLQISMQYFARVQFMQTRNHLEENLPDFLLGEIPFLLPIWDKHLEIPFLCKLHDDAEVVLFRNEETLFESHYVWMTKDEIGLLERCKQLGLFHGVVFFFVLERGHGNLFHCVDFVVDYAFDLEDFAVCPFAWGKEMIYLTIPWFRISPF